MTQKNGTQKKLRRTLLPFVGLALSFLVCGIMLYLFNIDPIKTYSSIFTKAFGSVNGISQTIGAAIPMIIVAAGIDFARKAGVFNIGAEGQMLIGALGAQLAAMLAGNLPPVFAITVTLLGGVLFGTLWAFLPALLKSTLNVNEIVVTIMMNQIAAYFIAYLVRSPLKDPNDFNNQSVVIADNAQFPTLIPGTKIHLGLIISIVLLVGLWALMRRTTFGYRVNVVGASPRASAYAGISASRTVFITFLIGGGIAGLAGANEIAGMGHRLSESVSNGNGFVGLTVAMIAGESPVMILVVSVLYSALQVGGLIIQITQHVPMQLANIIQAITVLFVLCTENIYQMYASQRIKKKKLLALTERSV